MNIVILLRGKKAEIVLINHVRSPYLVEYFFSSLTKKKHVNS